MPLLQSFKLTAPSAARLCTCLNRLVISAKTVVGTNKVLGLIQEWAFLVLKGPRKM